MMNLRQRSVNVARSELLEKLKINLELHRIEYKEALVEFKERLTEDLKLATKKVAKTEHAQELSNFRFKVIFPSNHESDYLEVIEMLEMSVDVNINLDAESFKAYIKNEWQWQPQFQAAKTAYSLAGSSITI